MARDTTAQHMASRLASLIVGADMYSTRWEIVAVAPVTGGTPGHQLVIKNPENDDEFIITVQKRSAAPALIATAGDAIDDPFADAERDDANAEAPF